MTIPFKKEGNLIKDSEINILRDILTKILFDTNVFDLIQQPIAWFSFTTTLDIHDVYGKWKATQQQQQIKSRQFFKFSKAQTFCH